MVMGADTSQNRFAACKSMLDYGFANFALYTPSLQEGAAVSVVLGKADAVRAVPGDSASLLVEKGQLSSVSAEVTLEESVTAPVSRGQRLGTLTVRSGEQILTRIPLVAEEGVSRMSWGDIFVSLLRRICMAKPA